MLVTCSFLLLVLVISCSLSDTPVLISNTSRLKSIHNYVFNHFCVLLLFLIYGLLI
jgi:hypothetical protein